MLTFKLNKYEQFRPLEVVCRGSLRCTHYAALNYMSYAQSVGHRSSVLLFGCFSTYFCIHRRGIIICLILLFQKIMQMLV